MATGDESKRIFSIGQTTLVTIIQVQELGVAYVNKQRSEITISTKEGIVQIASHEHCSLS